MFVIPAVWFLATIRSSLLPGDVLCHHAACTHAPMCFYLRMQSPQDRARLQSPEAQQRQALVKALKMLHRMHVVSDSCLTWEYQGAKQEGEQRMAYTTCAAMGFRLLFSRHVVCMSDDL
jgi:hypothetical protein